MKAIKIHVCENNDQGNPSGKVQRIAFNDHSELEYFDMEGASFMRHRIINKEGLFFRVDNEFSCRYHKIDAWVGNIHWNQYLISIDDAVSLFNGLAKSGMWHFTIADSGVFDVFENKVEITVSDFERYFEEEILVY